MRHTYRGIIFDLDGTMVNTEPYADIAWRHYLQKNGYDPEKMPESVVGAARPDCIRAFKETYGADFDYVTASAGVRIEKYRLFDEAETIVKEGLIPLMDYADANGIRMAIGSSSQRVYVDHVLEVAGLTGRFDAIVTGDDAVHGKPDPEIFLRSAELLGIIPNECIVIEDSRNGMLAGTAGGFTTLLIPDTGTVSGDPDGVFERVASGIKPAENLTILKNLSEALAWMRGRIGAEQ